MHLANMASSAASSKQMVISLETQMTEKDKIILKLEDSIEVKEEKLRLASEKET